jgi:hypothetical protein
LTAAPMCCLWENPMSLGMVFIASRARSPGLPVLMS